MCGVAGMVSLEPAIVRYERVATSLGHLRHRGPDDEGIASIGSATLGARRLSIIDLQGGHQPVSNEDGSVVVVQNGEIYNFLDLRRTLQAAGHRFNSRGDTEVIAHAYGHYGLDFVHHLRGMFAIAIWDERRRRLVLARDRLGKKPLFYAHAPGSRELYFASEIQALLAIGIDRGVDDVAVAEYLTYGYIPAPRSGFVAIKKVEPAQRLVFEDGRISTDRYWAPSFEPKRAIGFHEAAEEFMVLLEESVRLRLISDVPLGVLLSGGIDSSTVVALAARNSDRPVRTFSVGFSESDFDELRYARAVASRFGTEHHEFVVDPAAVEVLPQLVRHFGEPFADSSAIPTYYVSRMARQHVTVVLNGDGGDELLAGYDRYQAVMLGDLIDRLPWLASALSRGASLLPGALLTRPSGVRLRRMLGALALHADDRYLQWIGYFVGARASGIYGPRIDECRPRSAMGLARFASLAGARAPVERAMAADLLGYLPGDLLVKMDIATMANSLEARSPFLDHKLVEFVSALPLSQKVSFAATKRLLRHAVRDILPRQVLTRRKMGFVVPVGRWLRGPLRELLQDTLLASDARTADFIDPVGVRSLIAEHFAGRDRTPHVWSLLMLELWLRWCVEGAATDHTPTSGYAFDRTS